MIVPMKRLTLVAHKADEVAILEALQAIGAVEVIAGEEAQKEDDSLQKAESTVQKLSSALGLAKPYGQKKSMFAPKPEATLSSLKDGMDEALTLSDALEHAERARNASRAAADKCENQIEALTPWLGLDTPIKNIRATKHTALFAGLLPQEEVESLKELSQDVAVATYGSDEMRAVLIMCTKEAASEVASFIKKTSFADYNFPAMEGTPKEAVEALKARIEVLKKEQDELEAQMKTLGDQKDAIEKAADVAVIERDRHAANSALSKTESAFVLEGWVRADEQAKVEKAVASVTDACFVEFREPAEDEIPPAVVQNSNFASPYEAVTNLYSRPDPKALDGTPYMAPFYFFLFGMMLSDTGYGLVLFLGCLFFINVAKPTGMTGALTRVIMMGGLSTMVWGVLIGTFFGLSWNDVFGLGASGPFPLILDPMTQPIEMLFLCFGLGIIHILFGVILKMKLSFQRGDWQTAIFDNLSWIFIVLGLVAGLALPMVPGFESYGMIGFGLAGLGAVMILFMKGRANKNVFGRVASGLGGLYDVTSYLSDILSYARLFALGIATGVIGSVFNSLAGMIMSASDNPIVSVILVIIACVLLVFLHLFNIGINTLGTFVHCARLQYVEFYGKFYETGGKEFRPLTYKTKHVRVTR